MPKGNCSCRNIVLITVFSTATKDLLFIILEYSIQNKELLKMVYKYLIRKYIHDHLNQLPSLNIRILLIWSSGIAIYHKYVLNTNSLIFLNLLLIFYSSLNVSCL
jgi:hypothetical protein